MPDIYFILMLGKGVNGDTGKIGHKLLVNLSNEYMGINILSYIFMFEIFQNVKHKKQFCLKWIKKRTT